MRPWILYLHLIGNRHDRDSEHIIDLDISDRDIHCRIFGTGLNYVVRIST